MPSATVREKRFDSFGLSLVSTHLSHVHTQNTDPPWWTFSGIF